MSEQPDWWLRAKELEKEDCIEEAESLLEEAMRPLGYPWPAQSAQLHLERMYRMLGEGRFEEAKAAAVKGIDWMYVYASGATSGGEGTAYMSEVKQFEKEVRAALASQGLRLVE